MEWQRKNHLGWDPHAFQVDIKICTDQFVHCWLTPTLSQLRFACTFVYAHNAKLERMVLWKHLCEIADNCTVPWMTMGEFNNILKADERIGSPVTRGELEPSQDCVKYCNLKSNTQADSRQFAWTNKQDGPDRVLSKLDRVLANAEWIESFITAEVTFLP